MVESSIRIREGNVSQMGPAIVAPSQVNWHFYFIY